MTETSMIAATTGTSHDAAAGNGIGLPLLVGFLVALLVGGLALHATGSLLAAALAYGISGSIALVASAVALNR